MLFFAKFEGATPLLVDAADEADARRMLGELTADEILNLVPIPTGVFAAELFVDDEDNPGDVIVCTLLDDAAEFLEALDDGTEEEEGGSVVCGEEGDYDGETVVCCLAPHETGSHKGSSSSGDPVEW